MFPHRLTGLILLSLLVATPTHAVTVQEMAQALTEGHILPRYRALERAAAELEESAAKHCPADPDALKAAYNAVMDRWMRIQHIRFGPVQDDTRAARIQYWPDHKGRGRRQLYSMLREADPARLEPERFAQTSVAVQGLPALELILYSPPAQSQEPAYRCRVIAAIGHNLASLTAEIIAGWTSGPAPFRNSLEQPGPEDPRFRSEDEVTTALITDLHTSLRVIIDQKLARALSATPPNPKRAESWRSRRSLRNIRLNVEGIQALFEGEGGPGLAALVRARPGGDEAADQVGYVTKAILLTIESMDKPLFEAVNDPGSLRSLRFLTSSLETLDDLLREDVAIALDVPLGFNALDGD